MELSVIIPAYNEEKRLRDTLIAVSRYLEKRYKEYEIIVVDDGSSDGTRRIAEEIAHRMPNLRIISNQKNTGKGYSVKTGILASRGDKVLFTDADLSAPISELEKLENALNREHGIAIASRADKGTVILKKQNILRRYMGKTFNMLVRIFLIKGFKDTQCGFKLFRRHVALDLFSRQKLNGFTFDTEILYLAGKLGYKVKSVPVIWSDSPGSKVRIFSGSLSMLLELLKIKRLHSNL
jgi:dolichyl-phosphate beta-glucosyltransferase